MNRDRLLFDAKARALALLAEGYKPPEAKELRLPGPTGATALGLAVDGFRQQGKALPHDVTVSKALAEVLSGGATDFTTTVTEDQVQKLEKKAFLTLLRTGPTLARMEHMLTTGKPLRN
jgi:3-hydroxyacyl-CoA dehydrogenase